MVKLTMTQPLNIVSSHIGMCFADINPIVETGPFAGMSLDDIREIYSQKRDLLANGFEAWPFFHAQDGGDPNYSGLSSIQIWLVLRYFSLLARGRKPEETDWSTETLDSEFLHGFKQMFGKHFNGMFSVERHDLSTIAHTSSHLTNLHVAMVAAREFFNEFVSEFSLDGVTASRRKKKRATNPATPIRQTQVFGKNSQRDAFMEPQGASAEILPFKPRRRSFGIL